jgi:hypothetical protein
LPAIGKQFVDAGLRMSGNAREQITEISEGIDAEP